MCIWSLERLTWSDCFFFFFFPFRGIFILVTICSSYTTIVLYECLALLEEDSRQVKPELLDILCLRERVFNTLKILLMWLFNVTPLPLDRKDLSLEIYTPTHKR